MRSCQDSGSCCSKGRKLFYDDKLVRWLHPHRCVAVFHLLLYLMIVSKVL